MTGSDVNSGENIKKLADKNFVLLGAKRELRRLPEYLHDGEEVLDIVTGSRVGKRGRGIIVATSERLLIIWDGWVFRENQDFPYETISGIEFKVGVLFGTLTVYGKGDATAYNWVGRKSGAEFNKTVRRLAAKSSQNPRMGVGDVQTGSAGQNGGSYSDRIAALIAARDQGLITVEEFEVKKTHLMGEISGMK